MVNLSSKYLSYFDFKLLNRNLNFIPNPGKLNIKTFEKDVTKFSRKIMIQAHFGPQCKDNSNMFQPISKSTWTPPNPDHTVKTFIKSLGKDLLNNIENHVIKQNISKEEIKSLNKLESLDDDIITRADKGGAVVILDIKKIGSSLTKDDARAPRFYLLPKIHEKNNPGRPVVSSIDSPSSNIFNYVDFHLQPIVQSLKSYIKDTTDFINKLDALIDIPKDLYLVTLDVKSLYTNIPYTEGIQAFANALESKSPPNTSNQVLLKFLNLILTCNILYSMINITGCIMGNKCAPACANIFMCNFEQKYIF